MYNHIMEKINILVTKVVVWLQQIIKTHFEIPAKEHNKNQSIHRKYDINVKTLLFCMWGKVVK